MRRFVLLAAAMIIAVASFSQTALYQDDFESYTVGSYLAASNPEWWDTWSGAPGTGEDALISDDFANSPTKSALVDETGGATDLIFKMGNKTSGAYYVDFYVYVPAGYAGYYNFQHFESPGIEWALELYFNTDGTADLSAGGTNIATFNYNHDEWFLCHHYINLDDDWAEIWVEGVMIHEWQWSLQADGTAGTNQLGGIDFFAGAAGTDNPIYYFDDLSYEILPTILYTDDFETYTAGGYIAAQNPEWWDTWSGAPGTGEDGIISTAQSHSPDQSVLVDETGGATDLIWKLGDKVSGIYEVDWYMYIPASYAGYYNFQHFESPGLEWALELYFNTDGTADLSAGGTNIATFNYNHDEWFLCHHYISLDDDWAEIWVDGVMIHEWQWSLQADGTAGTNQLGGIDFFAGAAGTDNPMYYFDDVVYIQAAANQDPIILVDPTQLDATALAGTSTTLTLNVNNSGASDLDYELLSIYNVATFKSAPAVSLQGNAQNVKSLSHGNSSADPNAKPAAYNPPPSDDAVLHYDGDNYSAIGWNSAPISPTVAAMFPANMTNQYAGMILTSVDVYIADETGQGTDFYLMIYDMGNSYEPGTLLVEQAFTPVTLSWNNIVLNDPIPITGADIWVGYKFTQPVASIYIPGTDDGPNNPNGDFVSSGVGWTHLSNNPDLPYNWNIRANLTGNPIALWLSFDPASGSVIPGGSEAVTVTFDATGLDAGMYYATARVVCNDPETPQQDIPVSFDVKGVGTPEIPANNPSVTILPNPASDFIQITSTQEMTEIEIYNQLGQKVYKQVAGDMTLRLSTDKFESGVYYVKVLSAEGNSIQKFVVK